MVLPPPWHKHRFKSAGVTVILRASNIVSNCQGKSKPPSNLKAAKSSILLSLRVTQKLFKEQTKGCQVSTPAIWWRLFLGAERYTVCNKLAVQWRQELQSEILIRSNQCCGWKQWPGPFKTAQSIKTCLLEFPKLLDLLKNCTNLKHELSKMCD